jgi:glutamate dehydrogenase
MTIKTALFNLPYGGGKGGIIADLQHLSKKDQEGICRAYVKSIYRDIGPKTDIPAPDLGSNSEMMDWMNDEYKKITGEKSNGTFTGKTIEGGGSLGRTEATGYGVSYVTQYYVNKYMDEQGSYILQGFGNVGSHTALFMNKMLPKYKLLAVGDHTGYYYNKNGFDINYLFEYNKKNKSLDGITCDNKINKSDFFSTECDIVIPCALELEITKEIADSLKCKLVVEGANGPLSSEADAILNQKNITLVPDILANSGGVIVSYLEWYQNVNNVKYTYDDVLSKLEERLLNKMDEIYGKGGVMTDKRTECYVSSFKNLYKGMSQEKLY